MNIQYENKNFLMKLELILCTSSEFCSKSTFAMSLKEKKTISDKQQSNKEWVPLEFPQYLPI